MIVKIIGVGPKKKPAHDGLGGKHADGAIVDLPDGTALRMIAAGTAAPVEGGAIAIRKQAEEHSDRLRLAQQQARARQSMIVHDSMPEDVRHAVYEHGDEVTETYLAELDRQDSELTQPSKLNRKQRRMLRMKEDGGEG